MATLGLISISSYKLWCQRHGFSMRLEKSPTDREDELEFVRRQQTPVDPAAGKKHDPRRADDIRGVAAGRFEGKTVTEFVARVRTLFSEVTDVERGRQALLRLLLHVERYGNLLVCRRGLGSGHAHRNLVFSGLSQLARHHSDWIRPVECWTPSTHKADTQFAELAAHLLARYPVPRGLNAAWFEADPREAAIQQRWYKHIGAGHNIRNADDLPFRLTKKAAHYFMNPDNHAPPLIMLRQAQAMAIDEMVSKKRTWHIASSEQIWARSNADFWTSVVHFILNNPMLEPGYIGPLVDYIHHVKFEHRNVPQPGAMRVERPAHPSFCIKGRSIDKLIREVDDWHMQLSTEDHARVQEWPQTGFRGFALAENNEELRARVHWTIEELCTSALLQVEGRIMHHCVGSYVKRCMAGDASIWSLRCREDAQEAEENHILTIAVNNKARQVTQARGKFNLSFNQKIGRKKQGRIDSRYRLALRESARIMALWRSEEGLAFGQI